MLTVTPAQLVIDENGVPRSKQFDDSYFSSAGGAEECRHVFLGGNNIKSRIQNCEMFAIGEIGFGIGINFLTTAETWNKHRPEGAKLHYISIEKHPVTLEDLHKFYSRYSDSFFLVKEFLAHYPLPVAGTHHINFQPSNIALTLIFEDAFTVLPNLEFSADAWFLDGFAPNKNPELWATSIATEIFRLTKNHGTFASFSAARTVKENFATAGFKIAKQKGFGSKRDMLTGIRVHELKSDFPIKKKSWFLNKTHKPLNKHALVIGGGLAGAAVSAALAARNWKTTIIERHATIAAEASGNINAILMPRLSIDHDVQAQLTLQGYFYTLHYLSYLKTLAKNCLWHPCGVIQLPRDRAQWQRMRKIVSQENISPTLLRPVSQDEASKLSGCDLAYGGWYFPDAGWVEPGSICATLLEQYENILFVGAQEITSIEYSDGQWHALNSQQSTVATAEVIILANALSVNNFRQTRWCKLRPKRGQITLIPDTQSSVHPKTVICADAYITPSSNNYLALGASFVTNDTNTDIRESEHQESFDKVGKFIPGFSSPAMHAINGRAAIRAVSSDRLPIVGPVANEQSFSRKFTPAAMGASNVRYPVPDYLSGLYIASGFGSRGLAWIPICAEALACIINNEPLPFPQNIANAIHPNRFLMKQLVNRVQNKK